MQIAPCAGYDTEFPIIEPKTRSFHVGCGLSNKEDAHESLRDLHPSTQRGWHREAAVKGHPRKIPPVLHLGKISAEKRLIRKCTNISTTQADAKEKSEYPSPAKLAASPVTPLMPQNGRPRVGPFANPRRTKPFVRLNGDCSTTLLVSSDHLHELSSLEPCRSKPAGPQAATLPPVEQQLHANTGHPILSPNLLMSAARCSRRPSPVSSGHSGPKDHRRSRRWPRTA